MRVLYNRVLFLYILQISIMKALNNSLKRYFHTFGAREDKGVPLSGQSINAGLVVQGYWIGDLIQLGNNVGGEG